ncbi:hypothetical protein M6B38_419645 [Iris pallida]|uniref:Uncharacterized protein n=1 Tax=Iris pallida TaxID=29817 RepID=A0AAX6FHD3_IRIPA|nr:hypothetical protein M6B38_419645 [Iris pallida]
MTPYSDERLASFHSRRSFIPVTFFSANSLS